MEIGRLYNIKTTTKEKIGRNIYTAVFDDKEEYIAYINYSGILKFAKTDNLKETLYTKKDINNVFFYKDYLVSVDKNGKVSAYSFKNKSNRNYTLDCFNKYVFILGDYIYALEGDVIAGVSLMGDEKIKNYNISAKYNSFEDIYKGTGFISIFTKDCAYIYEYPEFKEKALKIKDYASKGIMAKNQIGERLVIYVNSKGEVVLKNGEDIKVLSEILNPHSISISEKLGLILIGGNNKVMSYDELGEKVWEKDMLSDSLVMNHKGDLFINVYKKSQAAAYEVISGAEKFSLDNLTKAAFSQNDNFIFGIEKSAY